MLIKRYRLKQCLQFRYISQLQCIQCPVGMKKAQIESFNMSMKRILWKHFNVIDLENDLCQCNKLFFDNIEYCRSSVYVVDLNHSHEQPVFAQITFILKKTENGGW